MITGPTAGGLGGELVETIARGHPEKIILLGREAGKVQPVIDRINEVDAKCIVVFISVHLDDLGSVRKAAEQVKDATDKIHYLINNAGIMAIKNYTQSKDGIESQFAVNHLSHFLLTNLLLACLMKAGHGSRVVNVTSDGYR